MRPELQKLNIQLPPDLAQRMRVLAAMQNRSLKDVYREAVERYVQKESKKA